MRSKIWLSAILATALLTVACFDPEDRRPGLALSGELVESFPLDWSFTKDQREIAIQVSTPYLVPHSVTIWCAEVEGQLYVGARDPTTKNWPGWVRDDPNVKLQIGPQIYEARLTQVEDEAVLADIREAYRVKYELPEIAPEDAPPIRYWVVGPRY